MPIRQPTQDPLAWWRRALIDPRTPRYEDQPQAGFYRIRKVKNGPWIPVAIVMVQEVDDAGELTEPERFEADEMGWEVDPLKVWASCRPISLDEYHALQERHRTDQAMAGTHAALDLSATPTRPRR